MTSRRGALTLTAVLAAALLTTAALTSCGTTACPAIGHISTVRLTVTPQRAQSLATLGVELCQDGACQSLAFDSPALNRATAGPMPLPTAPDQPRSQPLRKADGSIEAVIEIPINDHPLDVTTSGTDAQGWSIGSSHVRLTPTTTYPYGRQCGGPTTAAATLDTNGLRAG